jgi:RNA polymerase sigma-70 factor (ECF subfamily)
MPSHILPSMKAGAELDIEQLYCAWSDRLYAFAFRMLGDRDAALDVVQESFAVALAQADTFRGEAAPTTWLTAIARNLCLRRARRLRERTFEDFEAIIEQHAQQPTSAHSDPERRFYLAEVKQGCLIGLLQCLPLSQRCVFVLHILNDLSIADVASIIGKSQNSVRILLSRARSSMRRFLCQNCTLLGGVNCECANMIEFSLARHLIAPYQHNVDTDSVADDLRRFADEVELYRSLPNPTAAIAAALESTRFAIFAAK